MSVGDERADRSPDGTGAPGADRTGQQGAGDRSGPDPWRAGRGRRSFSMRDWSLRDTGKAVAVVAAAVVFVVPAVLLVQQRGAEAAVAVRQASMYTAPPLPTGSASAQPTPVIAIVGDESAVRSAAGVTAAQRWPGLLASALHAKVDTFAATDSGYATPGAGGVTFVQAAAGIPDTATVVLFVGGSNDAAVPSITLGSAVREALAVAERRAPKADIAMVGPVVADGLAPETLTGLRTTLATAARAGKVRWVAPTASSAAPAYAVGLTAADEQAIASRLETLVRQVGA